MGYCYLTWLSLLIIFLNENISTFRNLIDFFATPICRQEIPNKHVLINHLEHKDEIYEGNTHFFIINHRIAGLNVCSDDMSF